MPCASVRLRNVTAHLLQPAAPGWDAATRAAAAVRAAGIGPGALFALCTHEGGPHVTSYLDGLRDTTEVARSDPSASRPHER